MAHALQCDQGQVVGVLARAFTQSGGEGAVLATLYQQHRDAGAGIRRRPCECRINLLEGWYIGAVPGYACVDRIGVSYLGSTDLAFRLIRPGR